MQRERVRKRREHRGKGALSARGRSTEEKERRGSVDGKECLGSDEGVLRERSVEGARKERGGSVEKAWRGKRVEGARRERERCV